MSLSVLSVAYPFAPVGPDAVGGAEQVLSQLDRALVEGGHEFIVVACEGSTVAGALQSIPRFDAPLREADMRCARLRWREAIGEALRRRRIDVVHLHGVDFHHYLPPPGAPVLATLHLPASYYPPEALAPMRPLTWLNGVSESQHAALGSHPNLLPPIANGIRVEDFAIPRTKRDFVLMLTRICPEKGVHLAIDAAKRAGAALLIAGQVFPYPDHVRYFEQEVLPRLDRRRRFIGRVGHAGKRRLLAAARCVLVPSLVPETSSLVAREALASGTPVIGCPSGGLRQAVEHGRTGFLVSTVEDMADSIRAATTLDPDACRAAARERFSLARMVEGYFAAYERLKEAGRQASPRAA